jgi:methyl-accepting chemotaxis protein
MENGESVTSPMTNSHAHFKSRAEKSSSLIVDEAPYTESELKKIRTQLEAATETCEQAAAGNLEARVLHTEGSEEIGRLGQSINHLLDMTDAFLREVGHRSNMPAEENSFVACCCAGCAAHSVIPAKS